MNILFPTDFSDNSEVALRYAVDLLKKAGGKITLMHAFEASSIESIGSGDLDSLGTGPQSRLQQKVENDQKISVEKKLSKLAEKYGLMGEDYNVIAQKGSIRTVIDDLTHKGEYDVICLGTRGENTQRGFFFGGLADHLLKHAHRPVIAIPPKAEYKELKQIMYTTDLEHNEKPNLKWLIQYANIYQAAIHLVHVADDDGPSKQRDLQYLAEELPYNHITHEIISGRDVNDLIVGKSFDKKIDAISMTTHTTTLYDRLFHSSLASDVLERIDIPFIGFSENLVVH